MRLIEKLAELFNDKKLPLVADIRDESAEDIRIVIEPRARTIDPAVMMESLFRLSELETRFPLNLNVLVDGVIPRVVSLPEALTQWIDHRRVVLVRRSKFRLGEIERRLEVLAGMIIVFLNLDEVIRIIREEEEPKDVLRMIFDLSEMQVNYILDTRLRALRRLEEMELRKEHAELTEEKGEVEKLIASESLQWKTIAWQIRELKKTYGLNTKLGKRRTTFEQAPETADVDLTELLVEREPVTIVVSQKGWIRALKGHVEDVSSLQFKGDDALLTSFFAETTSKILVLATSGKIYTLEASKLPGGRGHGEPVRLIIDLDQASDLVAVFPYAGGRKFVVASHQGKGFIVAEDECVANTRKGKQVLNVSMPDEARALTVVNGELVAVIGDNRKMIVFPIEQLPEMGRGAGVRLQRYKDGGLSDVKVFEAEKGLTWTDSAARVFSLSLKELADWRGNRADAGRIAPKGFPRTNKFNGNA
jgi:topoisomerase-4 subunit A